MSASQALTGVELISCARANARRGLADAANSCGYGDDIRTFEQALQGACKDMGVDVTSFSDVVSDVNPPVEGEVVAPDALDGTSL
ncbi:MAG: hypothetical protein WBA10_18245 [Elainellaceae cyanobacterium]